MGRDRRKIIARLKRDGYELVAIRGSHHKLGRGDSTVVVPHPKRDLPIGTARSIARMAGWIEEDR